MASLKFITYILSKIGPKINIRGKSSDFNCQLPFRCHNFQVRWSMFFDKIAKQIMFQELWKCHKIHQEEPSFDLLNFVF